MKETSDLMGKCGGLSSPKAVVEDGSRINEVRSQHLNLLD